MIKREPASDISLSPRQSQLLELLIEGKSNKEISSELKIEPGTVKQHLFVLFRKLGVNSRAKAVIAAAQIMKSSAADSVKTKSSSATNNSVNAAPKLIAKMEEVYSWRLVTAVAVSIAELSDLNPAMISRRDQFFKALRTTVEHLVEALDGQVSFLPGGGSLIWFGHPRAHLDDADRALYVAQYLQSWSDQYQKTYLSSSDKGKSSTSLIGIGVASHTEVVSEKATDLFGAESFRKASILGRHAKSLNMPLSDLLTKKIASISSPWMEIQSKEGKKELAVKDVGSIAVIAPSTAVLPDMSTRWGGFPFLSNAFDGINSGLAQWLAVESWPAAGACSLIDAIGNCAATKNFQILRLRTPGSYRRDQTLTGFAAQIELQFGDFVSSSDKIYPSQGERIAGLLAEISKVGPLTVLVYGLRAFEALKAVIGEAGIDRLASRQVFIVAAHLQDTGSPQISVRLLGPKPNSAPFSRVFNLQMPAVDALPEGIRVDLRASLDSLSPVAKELVLRAANHLETPILSILSSMKEPHHKEQACIQELTNSGLIAPSPGKGFEFRDLSTALAIKHLCVPLGDEVSNTAQISS
ncbi:helix-turn-helix transcriptional regulator [Polynucleobacter sp. JS-Safj-400b-B2]|uniref:helix-turn-helix domain-containing protein n=1 Tax=Polynucleobacter sp. JS-Safj-400b-B2 TaxID=2576921 RepID=UPI001C0AF339|nr:helix-turn-helix transcriptional regulator [Polynucleobacter sp. JS-Safj-400b-B2]MBU3626747.1 helix-turn-helix transcriptional regulator [Polynucleobacter sp. JS-Safj-400b-B2]